VCELRSVWLVLFGGKPQYSDSNSNCRSVNPILASDIWKRLFPPRRSRWLPLSGSAWVPIPNTGIGIRMGSNINLFKLCSALRVLGYFMILLFAAIVALSYYAVVLITWGPLLFRSPLHLPSFFSAFFVLLLFHILLILLIWSYIMVVLNDPGSVPHNWRHHQHLRSGFDLETAPPTPSPAYCSRCQNGKPPRCHHCSICKQLSHFQALFLFLLFAIDTPFSPLCRPKVCSEDGSSLHLGRQLCWGT